MAFLLLVSWSLAAVTPQSARLDRLVTSAMQRHASPAWDAAASLFTGLGNIEIAAVLFAAIGFAFVTAMQTRRARVLWLLFAAGTAVEWLSKRLLPHPIVPIELRRSKHYILHHLITTPYGYPSGHAFRTLLIAAAILMGWSASPAWWNRIGRISLALLPLLMGAALIYMGDHWLSEVVGGYLLGAIAILVLVATGSPAKDPRHGSGS